MHVICAQKPSLFIPDAQIHSQHNNHQYIGDQQLRIEELDIIDLVSARSYTKSKIILYGTQPLSPPSLLSSIKGQMRVIWDNNTKEQNSVGQ